MTELQPATFRRTILEKSTGSGFGLPPDLLGKSRRRVRMIGLLTFAGSFADTLLMIAREVARAAGHDFGTPSAGAFPFVANMVSVVASATLVGASWTRRVRDTRLLSMALVFEVLMCLVISISNPVSRFQDKGVVPVLTWVTPLIILFPLIVPYPPRRTLVTAIAAAATAPLGLHIVRSLGLVHANSEAYFAISFGPLLAVAMAYYGSRVVYGLGLDIAEARRMGSYRLERMLGRGGMGEVWLARHQLLARPAAIKLVRPDLVGARGERADAALVRFEREAQATAALRSPHTIGLYDFGIAADGTFFYVMELLDGLDAETLVTRFGPVPPGRAVHLLRQVCHSLAEAHEAGLIHRDIKPANIYICRYGRDLDFVKVLDFGLVKTLAEQDMPQVAVTADNTVCGTPAYLAPELAMGKQGDARSDIYALGCVAYWLLTGELVFAGDTPMEILVHHARTTPLPPSQRVELPLPSKLESVVMTCLQKDPRDRPQSAAELARLLSDCDGLDAWTSEHAARWWTMQPAAI